MSRGRDIAIKETAVKRTAVTVAVCLGVLGGFGCGGEEEKTPRQKCEDLVSQICDRIVECVPGAEGMQAACVQEFQSRQSCQSIKSVSASFDDCMDKLDSLGCAALFSTTSGMTSVTLPLACNGVLMSRDAAPALELATPLSGMLRGVVDGLGQRSTGTTTSPGRRTSSR